MTPNSPLPRRPPTPDVAPAPPRRRVPLVAAMVVVAAALVAATGPGAVSAGAVAATGTADGTTRATRALPAPDQAIQDFVDRINSLRAGMGLGTLRVDPELSREAMIWASTMDDAGRIFHSDDLSRGITADWHRLGENVGVGGDVDSLFQAFVASPSHYANLVEPGYTHVGVGVVNSPDGVRLYTAHRFMSLRTTPAPAPAPPPEVRAAPPAAEPPAPEPPTPGTPTTAPPSTTTPPTSAAPPTTVADAALPKLGPVDRVADLLA
ncbi:MAG: CAP domain-containing protein [Microthrixaceae bacterium]